MQIRTTRTFLSAAALILVSTGLGRAVSSSPGADTPPAAERVQRGGYLVGAMGCNDCHTPWKLGPQGPEPDMSRALSGHPADFVVPPPPRPSDAWTWSGAATNTAFAGPWGISFAANLTPDKATGLGDWTYAQFSQTMRQGKHLGIGRDLLPPMPWMSVAVLNDTDMRALFAYLRSIKPIANRVPAPIPPK